MKQPCVYIMTNKYNKVLYVGVTSDLVQRVERHKTKFYKKSFTAQYNCDKLVYYCHFATMLEAIAFEKKLKAGSRAKKVALVEAMNPDWVEIAALRSQ
ncbi:MAG: GIY-YIG nuclease family protein [Flavobacteriaceae bacterium]|nr:GIY-YIG nuclease family protein [Flavobacteriaceae bacterium]